ncbi:MAG: hypothetical protein J6A01_10385 [Proteobacteria bacterium]|nr:hypothetical protein [Pseudomonadota bacterium]
MNKITHGFFTKIFFIALFACVLGACNDDEKKEAEFKAKVEKTRTVLSNHCSTDSDCMVTGCHKTMCRAMPEPEYCEQRIVLDMDDKNDIPVVRGIVSDLLTVREAETVRIGGYAAGKWTLSFMATQAQRERIETTLNHISQSGFARIHPNAETYSQALFDKLADPDSELRTMKGVGILTEKKIRSGDVLSKDDVRNTWALAAPSLDVKVSDNDDIELLWGYDVLFDTISHLRFWPVDKRQRISIRLWKEFDYRTDNGDIILTAQLADPVVDTFKQWTQDHKLIVVLLGNEVLATTLPEQIVSNGHFDIVIHDGAKNETLIKSMETLKAVSQMTGGVRLDRDSTQKVERDITCHEKYPRECGCIEGSCGWKLNIDYNACLYGNDTAN